ncbi:MAG: hypothetical protein IJ870_04070, partial [Alphaproteobacteria bacterium]|nr:hypothetical protein [Alphaproteobacteria bacterium]
SSSPRVRFYCKDTETRSCTSISNDSYTWVTIWTYTLEDGVYCYNSYCYTSGEEMLAGSSSSCGDAATCQRVIEEREAGNCVSLSDCQTYIAEHPQTQTSEGGVEPVGGDEPAGGNESQGSAEPEGNEDPETNNNEAQENGTTDVSQMPSESQTPIATANANRDIKRIYTVEEASAVSKPTGNTFRLRYK